MKTLIIAIVMFMAISVRADDVIFAKGQPCYVRQHWWSSEEEGIIIETIGVDEDNKLWIKVKTRDGRIHDRFYDLNKCGTSSAQISSYNISKTNISTEDFQKLFPSNPPGKKCPACDYDEKTKEWKCRIGAE